MKLRIFYVLFLFACFSGTGLYAFAEDSTSGVSGNVAATTDYIWRGATQTDNKPAIQGGYDFEYEGLYAGLWGSNVLGGSEFDVYGGYNLEITGIGISIGAIRYIFPHADDADATEALIGLSYSKAIELGITFYYDTEKEDDPLTSELTAGYLIGNIVNINGTYGVNGKNKYYQASISKELLNLEFSINFGGTQPDTGDSETAFAFAISKSI